jgi:excisionase family DNA binding protein
LDEKFFTIEELAAHFKVTRQTIQNWIRTGKLESIKLGRSRRIPSSAVEKMVAESKQASSPDRP